MSPKQSGSISTGADKPLVGELVPVDHRPQDLIEDWLGGSQEVNQIIRTNLDLTGAKGVALASRLLLDSDHDNSKLDGKEFTVTGVMITAGKSVDNKTGEIKVWPRTAMPCNDGTHLVFGGIVALRSALLMVAGLKPEDWSEGVKVRVHAQNSKPGGVMHRLEVIS